MKLVCCTWPPSLLGVHFNIGLGSADTLDATRVQTDLDRLTLKGADPLELVVGV